MGTLDVTKTDSDPCFEGWLTPPPSAHNHRRPSLYSLASTDGSFSQPPTPVSANDVDSNGRYFRCHVAYDGFGISNQKADCDSGNCITSPLACSYNGFGCSSTSVNPSALIWSNDTGLTPALFSNQSLSGTQQASELSLYNSSHPTQALSLDNLHLDETLVHHGVNHDGSATAQVLVPSQLSPQTHDSDYAFPTYCRIPQQQAGGHSKPRDSDLWSLAGNVASASPVGSQDAEGWVKVEYSDSPSSIARVSRRPGRTTERSSRRCVKKAKAPKLEDSHVLTGQHFDLRLSGSAATSFKKTGVVKMSTSSLKPFRCDMIGAGGVQCSSKFKRGEHLIRHKLSHSGEKIDCVFDDCKTKKIGPRSDNACDHYRTHLRGGTTSRNTKLEWPDLKHLLMTRLDRKESKPMIENLTRWILTKKGGEAQRHWLLS